MARLELELDGSGIKRGADLAERELDQVKKAAVETEVAIDRLADSGAADMQRLATGTQRATTAARQLAAAQTQQVSAFGRSRGAIQNTAFQIGDFATQVAAGTAASTALAQQLPQLLGGFGVFGAVAGAAAAILVPLAANFLFAGEEAKSAADAIDEAAEANRNVRSTLEESASGLEVLAEKYGDVTLAVVELRDALDQLALEEQTRSLNAAVAAIVETSALTDVLGAIAIASQDAVTANDRLVESLGITSVQAYAVAEAYNALKNAENFEDQATAAASLRRALEDVDGTSLDGVIGEIIRLEDQLRQAAGTAQATSQSIRAAITLANQQGEGLRLPDGQIALPDAPEPEKPKPGRARRAAGGGGRSAASQVDRLAESYQRLRGQLDPAFRAQTQFTEAQQTLNDALAAGKISQQEYNDTLALARQRFEEATQGGSAYARIQEDLNRLQDLGRAGEQAAKQLQQSFADFLFDPFSDGIEGMVRGFADGLRRILSEIISAQITQKIVGLFPSIFGGGGGVSSALASAIGFYDSGGYIPSGKTGVVAERRPEFVNGALINSPTVLRGPANITGGAATARAAASPQVNQKNVFVFDRAAVAGEVTRDPGFKTAVVDIMRMQGVLNA